jgi:serine/threonine protein phosphatase PrpC
MVADGMGGAAAGDIASRMAIETVLQTLRDQWTPADRHDADTFVDALRQATETANATIHGAAAAHPEHQGMGSTATIAGLLHDTLYLAQVGDSRAYVVRDGTARQITKDQSLVQRLVDAGALTEEEAEVSDRRNIILQALGPEANIRIDLTHQRVRRGDVLILCSDGLSGVVRADNLARVVTEEPDLLTVCNRLIEMANEAGGPDNITVIAVRFDGDGLSDPNHGDAVQHRVYIGEAQRCATATMSVEELASREEAAGHLRPTPLATRGSAPPTAPMRGPSARTINMLFAFIAFLVVGFVLLQFLKPVSE